MSDDVDIGPLPRRLLARVENPVQFHELWVEDRPGDPALNMGHPTYPVLIAIEQGGEYRGERAIDLGTLVHLMLNVGEEELHQLAGRATDAAGQDTEGPPADGCAHGIGARRRCNSCVVEGKSAAGAPAQ